MIKKESLLSYLELSPEKIDLKQLSLWLEANSDGELKIKKLRKDNIEYAVWF